jgi:hypothetical protein
MHLHIPFAFCSSFSHPMFFFICTDSLFWWWMNVSVFVPYALLHRLRFQVFSLCIMKCFWCFLLCTLCLDLKRYSKIFLRGLRTTIEKDSFLTLMKETQTLWISFEFYVIPHYFNHELVVTRFWNPFLIMVWMCT